MKELSNQCPITQAFPSSKTVVIPVTMGGAPNSVLVQVGDTVVRGQKIAESDKFMSAPVHASVSGKVVKIETHLVTANQEVPCIFIESDGTDSQQFMDVLDPFKLEKEEILKRIKDAGIVGMGGASFPTHVKLNPPADKKVQYVLVNAAECEPYLTIDERTLQERTAKVIDGLAIVLKLTDTYGYIALEDNKAYIKPVLEAEIQKAGYGEKMEVALVKTKYPQGAEKFIVASVLRNEIPSGGLPADAGAIICNVGTVCAISDAFRLGKPLIDRPLTVSGMGVDKPCNLEVPVGTLVKDLIGQNFNVDEDNTVKIVSGGPMMGFAMQSADFPIAKGTSGVLFLTKKDVKCSEEDQCIGCGKCMNVCAMRLNPVLMLRALKAGNTDKARDLGLMDCIECGCCAFICPAHVKIVQRIRLGKGIVRSQMAAQRAKAEAEKAKGDAK